jgi:hypothetical protein
MDIAHGHRRWKSQCIHRRRIMEKKVSLFIRENNRSGGCRRQNENGRRWRLQTGQAVEIIPPKPSAAG